MSADYSVRMSLGFTMEFEDFRKYFEVEVEELSHREPFYDSRTGQFLYSTKVVDRPGGQYLQFKDSEELYGPLEEETSYYESTWSHEEFFDLLSEKLECEVFLFPNQSIVGFDVLSTSDYSNDLTEVTSEFTVGSSIPIKNMAGGVQKRLADLTDKLRKWFPDFVAEPKIYIVAGILH
jgi:hypothetical protein